MSHCYGGWVQVGVRRLRSSKAAGILHSNPYCTAKTAAEAACKRASSSRSRSLTALSVVRYASGASYGRELRSVQLRPANSASTVPNSFGVLQTEVGRMPGSCFSTSTDADSKKQTETESQPDKESDDVPVAEAGVEEVEKLAKEEPRHAHIEMPSITEVERTATLTSWNVQVGDAIEVGDVVCEIELEHFHVGVKVDTPGFLAEILVEAGTKDVPVGADIGTLVHTEEDIALYQQAQISQAPPSGEQEVAPDSEESFSWKDVLKHVLLLRNQDKLSEDEASDLMSLARNKDSELLQAFEGCFDGEFQGEIDSELFLVQAKDIAKTRRKA